MVLYIIGLGLGDEKDITVRYVATARGGSMARPPGMQCILGARREAVLPPGPDACVWQGLACSTGSAL